MAFFPDIEGSDRNVNASNYKSESFNLIVLLNISVEITSMGTIIFERQKS